MDLRRILVPIDFSEHSARALDYALDLAQKLSAEVTVLHVWDFPRDVDLAFGMSPVNQMATLSSIERAAREEALDFVAEHTRKAVPDDHVIVRQGVPARVIVDWAHGSPIDLIVMGTHGRSGLMRFFMGSVAERVVRHAPCPVLTVRPQAHGAQAAAPAELVS